MLLIGVGAIVALFSAGGAPPVQAPKLPGATSQGSADSVDEARIRQRSRRALSRLARRALGERREFKVRVSGCGLMPSPGAEVQVIVEGAVVASGQTDEVGVFEARVPAGAELTVVARAEDQQGSSVAEGAAVVDLNICPGATFEGRVVDRLGVPRAGVTVTLGEDQDLAITDDAGHFVLTDLYLTADRIEASSARGRASASLGVVIPAEVREVELVLIEERRLVGTVVDRRGDAVGYATIDVRASDGRRLDRVRSDRQGRFWLNQLPFEALSIQADGGEAGLGALALDSEHVGEELLIRLQPAARLVLDWDGPWPGRFVVVDDAGGAEIARFSRSGDVVVVAAPKRLVVRYGPLDDDAVCGVLTVTPGSRSVVSCGDEPRVATLSGRVVDRAGQPLADVEITGGGVTPPGRRTRSDARGEFTLELSVDRTQPGWLKAGRFAGDLVPSERRNLTLTPGAQNRIGDVVLQPLDQVRALMRRGPFGGIGGQVAEVADGIMLSRIVSGGPLDQAGAQAGDIILGIDGSPAALLGAFDAVRALRGADGTSVTLTIRRGDGMVSEVVVRREIVDVRGQGWVN